MCHLLCAYLSHALLLVISSVSSAKTLLQPFLVLIRFFHSRVQKLLAFWLCLSGSASILHMSAAEVMCVCAAPDMPKPAGLRAARPGPSAKPSMHPRTASSSTGVRPSNSAYPSLNGPSRPPPAPSAKAAAALYRQQSSALTSRSSQLTASLKGSSVSTPSGRPSTVVASNGQAQRAAAPTDAALRPADGVTQQARPVLSAHGFQPLPRQTADQSAQPSASHDSSAPAQPLADHTLGALASQRGQGTAQSAGQQSTGTADATSGPNEPARASYASKVGILADPDSSTPASTQGTSRHRSRHKHHSNRGRGRGYGRHRPHVEAAEAASSEAAGVAQDSSGREQPAALQAISQQQSPFASQKSWSFGRQAEAATEAAASAADQSNAQMENGARNSNAQPGALSKQQQQQHPPFRDTQTGSGSHDCSDDEIVSQGGAESSLGTENYDPRLTHEKARAASGRKAAAASKDLLASPFKAINLDSMPSFAKPLPASKTKEFPSSRSSGQQLAAPIQSDGGRSSSQAQPAGKPDQAKPASPDALREEGSERATAPPKAADTSGSQAPAAEGNARSSPPAANGLIRPNGLNRQGQLLWEKAHAPTSPNTPLALPDSSELSFKQSEALQSSGCSDSGFSLLWDDDPFWQVSDITWWRL